MQTSLGFLISLIAAAAGYWIWHRVREYRERQEASEARMAGFVAQSMGAARPAVMAAPEGELVQQRLLMEAAAKAGEAGEAVLAIQLYARLIARYPASGFVAQARAAVEAQKKRLGKA